VQLDEAAIPVAEPVQSVCEMLGYDPLYLACEGRVVAVVAANHVERVLSQWRKTPNGSQAALIGQLQAAAAPAVVLNTRLGGQRFVDELIDDPLPRIC
jgi:hydrogenase expression/formation protein HypE